VSAAQDVLPGHFLLSEGILLIVYAMGNAQKQLALVLQDNFGSTLGLIAVLLAVLLFAYYATRYIGKKSGGLTRAAHMRVKERVMLQKDKSVVLLETKDKYYLIGVTGAEHWAHCRVKSRRAQTTRAGGSGTKAIC
jgi:flagellar protein FliO/FliZ